MDVKFLTIAEKELFDGTEVGVANELVEMGVPKEDIVLAFYAPYDDDLLNLPRHNLKQVVIE